MTYTIPALLHPVVEESFFWIWWQCVQILMSKINCNETMDLVANYANQVWWWTLC